MAIFEKIWNQFDEMGLMVSVPRVPGEGNSTYRYRLLNHDPYNSTKQGIANFISSLLLQPAVNLTDRLAFTSLRVPLSYSKYRSLLNVEDDYYQPRVIIGADTWIIEPSDDDQKDVSNTINGVTWTLWKQPDGAYDQIWTTNVAPTENIEFRYQWNIEESSTPYVVRERPTLLSWEDGEVVEVDPDDE
jgi:hypothetical protein